MSPAPLSTCWMYIGFAYSSLFITLHACNIIRQRGEDLGAFPTASCLVCLIMTQRVVWSCRVGQAPFVEHAPLEVGCWVVGCWGGGSHVPGFEEEIALLIHMAHHMAIIANTKQECESTPGALYPARLNSFL